MVANQVVTRLDGSTRLNPDVGELPFVESEDHRHWHFIRFMRYELVRPTDDELVAPDRKTGFCLGDRYDTRRSFANKPREPVFRGGCGFRERDWLRVREGISVGYGDYYKPELEGQYLDITRVPAGRYHLVHHVNADRRLRETKTRNNVASLLFTLEWPRGFAQPPRIDVLRRCAGTARCGYG